MDCEQERSAPGPQSSAQPGLGEPTPLKQRGAGTGSGIEVVGLQGGRKLLAENSEENECAREDSGIVD